MNIRKSTTESPSLLKKLSVVLVLMFIAIQLYVLSTVGTQGERVSELRDRQAEVKIENEILRARISELQSTTEIRKTANEHLQMQPAQVVYVDASEFYVAAQQ
ncbi:MAG: Cell division protein FtsL [candidate division WS6 bacterium OLB20]|uniref:Cell division protein FtsL n=1 Tax=candidate division WS6 bacterium OLB20 TaxID=1617426 RepID=A0A136M0H5_9BACT|nr:MAG: Cell division protein FtsL [candidate division WS6 bacterium OLB20]